MTTVPSITPLPAAPNRNTDSPSEFSTKADSFTNALPTFGNEANAVGQFASDTAAAVSGIGMAAFQTVSLADTADSDPGAGKLKFNNATQRDATELYLDDEDIDGTTIRAQIAKFDDSSSVVKGDLSLRKRDDKSKWLVYEVTDITQKTGYTVAEVQNGDGGSGSPFADTDDVVVGFTRAGDQGNTGASDFDWTTKTSAYTASKDDRVLANTSSGSWTLTLPSGPTSGNQVAIADPAQSWEANNLTVNGNGNNIEGAATFAADVNGKRFIAVYDGAQWRVYV